MSSGIDQPKISEEFGADWRRRFRAALRRWYAQHARDLPWRGKGHAYQVWISEIMLQQTTVAAVVPYFARFLERFPDVATLAAAEEHEVLRYWEGLGYYSRARNIHKTAQILAAEHGGVFPDDVNELQTLPGIGRYTAGAIASFAFDRPAAIVEANTLRLYCRLLGYDGDPRSSDGQRLLWQFATEILPRKSAGDFNQALIDLGATVCTPQQPDCAACPVKSCCRAFLHDSQQQIPRPKPRPEITNVTEAALALQHGGKYLLCRRPAGERWAGLWDFPRFSCGENSSRNGHRLRQVRSTLRASLLATTGLKANVGDLLTEIRHSVTRYRIQLYCFSGELDGRREKCKPEIEHVWAAPAEFSAYALSVTGRKLADLLK